METAIHWFRRALRLSDNKRLNEANAMGAGVEVFKDAVA